jgi:hypothetical protein
MPGFYVFPGGIVDNEDKSPALWKGQVGEEEDVVEGLWRPVENSQQVV